MGDPPTRVLRLRYRAQCAVCLGVLEPGTRAEWDSERKVATCVACGRTPPAAPGPPAQALPAPEPSSSLAGGSARAEGDRRRAAQQARLRADREARPVVARIRQGLFPEPDAGAPWHKGAVGEEQLAASMNPLVEDGTISALHDRRIPRSSANIDHLVVAASGLWVIDAKRYSGRIAKDVRGGFFNSRTVLSVGGRDRTSLVDGMKKQVAVVQGVLSESPVEAVAVHAALCFVDGDWGLRLEPFAIDGVLVTWPRALRARLAEPGHLDSAGRELLVGALARALPPAS